MSLENQVVLAEQVVINKFGASKLLKVESKAISQKLAAEDVHIEVHYSGINFADIMMRLGLYRDAPPKPFVPGYEFSGIIKKVGSKVINFKVGDKVLGGTRFGGYVSDLIIPSWQVVPLNKNLTLEQGAALPVNFITAYIALHEIGRIREGDKVLLDCATGGVGVLAIKMCVNAGATVIGLTTTPAKKAFIESLGGIAYTTEEFKTSGEKDFDYILNSSGGKSLKWHYELLAKSGKLTCIGLQSAINDGKSNMFKFIKIALQVPKFNMIKLTMESKCVSGFNALKYFEDEEWMKRTMAKIADTDLIPHVGQVFDAHEVSKAHEFLEQRKAKGKVLLNWKH
jgi:NADPH:quinone reductase-like Zn-dependent oxidoreductase